MATTLTAAQLAKLFKVKDAQALGERIKAVIDALNEAVIKGVKVNGTALTPTGNVVDVIATVEKLATAETGFASSYQFKVNGVAVGDKINIAKDKVVKSAELLEATAQNYETVGCSAAGKKYIDLVINTVADGDNNTETDTHIYLPVEDLVDVYLAGNGLQLDPSTNTFSIKLDSSYLNGLKVGANGLGLDLAADASTTYVAATGTYVSGTTYYTSNTGATEVDTTGFEEDVTDVSSYFVANVSAAVNGAMSGADKGKLDKISDRANRTTVTTEKAGTIEIDGVSKTIVEIATDTEVTTMLNEIFPVSSGT